VTAIRVAPNRIRVVGGTTLDAAGWRARTRALAVINGGYFDANGRSLGLRISLNKRTSNLHPADWGVFYIKGDAARIVHTSAYKALRDAGKTTRVLEAIQCGPRLVVNGKPTRLKPQWARRSGIGIDRSGQVILAVADGELSFAAWQRLWASRNGLDCPNALNLDGGGSTQLSLGGKHPRQVGGAWAVPDACCHQITFRRMFYAAPGMDEPHMAQSSTHLCTNHELLLSQVSACFRLQ
jgi:uncharacterized protein YigE (DUF2233 family)